MYFAPLVLWIHTGHYTPGTPKFFLVYISGGGSFFWMGVQTFSKGPQEPGPLPHFYNTVFSDIGEFFKLSELTTIRICSTYLCKRSYKNIETLNRQTWVWLRVES